jgi:hypothetical protein
MFSIFSLEASVNQPHICVTTYVFNFNTMSNAAEISAIWQHDRSAWPPHLSDGPCRVPLAIAGGGWACPPSLQPSTDQLMLGGGGGGGGEGLV